MPRERIAKVNPNDIGRPMGAYRVELLDRHTGKVRERVEAANYISPMLLDQMKWQQAMNFHRGLRFAHLGTAVQEFPNDVGLREYRASPTLPIEFIAGLSSDIAENSASSWGTGRVIGFASRWKTTIPAGSPRGQINEAQSEMTLDGSKVVFDFNEDQGNGTINSLAICRLVPDPFARTTAHPSLSARMSAGPKFFNFPGGGAGGIVDPNYWNLIGIDWATSTIHALKQNPVQVATVDFSGITPNVEGDYDLSTLTSGDVTFGPTLSGPVWTTGSTTAGINRFYYFSTPAIASHGANWILAYQDGYGNVTIGSWVKATGARNWWTEVLSGGTTNSAASGNTAGVAVIGGKAYVSAMTGSVTSGSGIATSKAIHRVDLATGVVDATLPYGTDAAGNDILARGGLATDGTDLFILTTHGGICRYTTAGVFVEAYGDPVTTGNGWNETGLTPWDTNFNYQDLTLPTANREQTGSVYGNPGAGGTDRFQYAGPDVIGSASSKILSVDGSGKLWLLDGSVNSQIGQIHSIDGGNIFSRAALDTAVNKTTSSTMKWTYEITFPSEWRAISAHPVPPS